MLPTTMTMMMRRRSYTNYIHCQRKKGRCLLKTSILVYSKLNYLIGVNFFTSHTLRLPSRQPEAKWRLFELHAMLVTGEEWSLSSLSWDPAAKSKMRIFDSSPPAASIFPSGLKQIQLTGCLQSEKTLINFPLVTHHKRTEESTEPVAI